MKHAWTVDTDGVECIHVDHNHAELGLAASVSSQPGTGKSGTSQLDGTISIWEACRRGDLSAVKRAVDCGVDVNGIDQRNISADDSTWLGQLFLAASGSTAGQSPLSLAAVAGHVEVVRFLLEHGAQGVDAQLFSAVSDDVRVELERHGFSRHGRLDEMTEVERARYEAIQQKRRELSRTHDVEKKNKSEKSKKSNKQKKSWFSKRLDELYDLRDRLVGKRERNEVGFVVDE